MAVSAGLAAGRQLDRGLADRRPLTALVRDPYVQVGQLVTILVPLRHDLAGTPAQVTHKCGSAQLNRNLAEHTVIAHPVGDEMGHVVVAHGTLVVRARDAALAGEILIPVRRSPAVLDVGFPIYQPG